MSRFWLTTAGLQKGVGLVLHGDPLLTPQCYNWSKVGKSKLSLKILLSIFNPVSMSSTACTCVRTKARRMSRMGPRAHWGHLVCPPPSQLPFPWSQKIGHVNVPTRAMDQELVPAVLKQTHKHPEKVWKNYWLSRFPWSRMQQTARAFLYICVLAAIGLWSTYHLKPEYVRQPSPVPSFVNLCGKITSIVWQVYKSGILQ